MECRRCKEEDKTTVYYGESARTPFDRGLNHLESMERLDPDHPVVNHYMEDHPGLEPACDMRVIRFEEKNLYRRPGRALL